MNERSTSRAFHVSDFFRPKSYYWQTRQWSYFKQGIPAIVISLLILLPVLIYPLTRKNSIERYRVAFNTALRNQQFETANLFSKKLESLSIGEPVSRELQFNRALVDLGRGQTEKAIATINSLAPDDAFGYGPAHRWLAQMHLNQDPALSGEKRKIVAHHLESALQFDPDSVWMRRKLGHIYYENKEPEKAAEHLTKLVDEYPEEHYLIANLHAMAGHHALAEEHFRQAAEVLAAKLEEDPQNVETRMSLAVSLHKIGKPLAAITTLEQGHNQAAPNPSLAQMLSSFYLIESDRLRMLSAQQEDVSFAESLEYLFKSIRVAPNNDEAVSRIAEIAAYEGETAEKANDALKQLLAQGKMPAKAHVILGTSSLQKGDLERAKRHYGLAYRLDPEMPALLNNIAWLLMVADPPELEKSLSIINVAIAKVDPESRYYPFMLDTRGQIYVKMEQWESALVDLERALVDMTGNPQTHRALAKTYLELGEEELAREHEELAKSAD